MVQLALSAPFSLTDLCGHGALCARAREVIGRVVFWLVMGTLGVVGGTVVWLLSSVYAPIKWHSSYRSAKFGKYSSNRLSSVAIVVRYVVVFLWCIVGAPLYLAAFWLATALEWAGLQPWSWVWNRRMQEPHETISKSAKTLHEMLADCRGGLTIVEQQFFLEDPMRDPEVWQDEKSRPTTVEHIKQLRDRVENTIVKLG